MTSSNGNIFRVTGPLCGEFTGHRWIPHTKTSDVELWCFTWSAPWINGWVNNRAAGDLRRHRAHYDVIALFQLKRLWFSGVLHLPILIFSVWIRIRLLTLHGTTPTACVSQVRSNENGCRFQNRNRRLVYNTESWACMEVLTDKTHEEPL